MKASGMAVLEETINSSTTPLTGITDITDITADTTRREYGDARYKTVERAPAPQRGSSAALQRP